MKKINKKILLFLFINLIEEFSAMFHSASTKVSIFVIRRKKELSFINKN